MTDFAQDPLWEEEAQEPENRPAAPRQKEEPQADPKSALAAAGNAAAARAIDKPRTPAAQKPAPVPPAPVAPKLAAPGPAAAPDLVLPTPEPMPVPVPAKPDKPKAKRIEPPKPAPVEDKRKTPDDWKWPLQRLLSRFETADPAKTLPPLLEAARDMPKDLVPRIAGQIVAAFLRLPAGLRKPKRDALVAVLGDWPQNPLARLILTRLGGIPVAAPPPPPPPPPPADP